jgi:predicted DNA-binding WGR domain protein
VGAVLLLAMRIYMQTTHQPEQPPRFYQLQIQKDLLGGWLLIRESGVQGMRGQVKSEHFEERDQAERRLIHFRDQQSKRGYRVVFREGAQMEAD